jgi:hypothetical protein
MDNHLADVCEICVPEQQSVNGDVFPLVVQCGMALATLNEVVDWICSHRSELQNRLHTHGAILFRGFPLNEIACFDQFITAFKFENFPYEESLSNAVRINYTPRVFSANEAPSEVTIHLHHEMAQTPIFPSKLFFFCLQPAEKGGATPLCRSDVLFEQMREHCPGFAENCEEKGLRYTGVMPSVNDANSGMGRSWQRTFQAENREQAEQRMSKLGYDWNWLPDGCLQAITPVLPAVREVSAGRKVFFNQLIAASQGWKDDRNDPSKSVTFGDGSPLDRDAVLLIAKLAEQLTFDLVWQHGDVALIDNFLVMHGRRTFQGERKILASLVAST